MSYYDDDCYDCNRGGGFIFAIAIVLFPLLPYMVTGYEIGKAIMDINAVKWGLALLFGGGIVFLVIRVLTIRLLYMVLFLYLSAVPLMFLLSTMITDNSFLNSFVRISNNVIQYCSNWLLAQ